MSTSARKTQNKRPRQISELVTRVMEPVLSRRAGMTMDLLAAWPELVGEEYADYTRPQKINWPNRAHEDDPFKPGILIVACDGARALFFQHDLSRICARVNVFFGYSAIEKIKIIQKPVQPLKKRRITKPLPLSDEKQQRLQEILSHVDDPQLRDRLEILGRGVMGKRK